MRMSANTTAHYRFNRCFKALYVLKLEEHIAMFSLSLNGSYKVLKRHKGHNESGTNTQKILRTDILQQMHYFQFNLL